jgi:putative heme-binding domain-containing protein
MDLLRTAVADADGRVRLEAARALSFVDSTVAAETAVEIAKQPMDYWTEYTLQHTLAALEPRWKPALEKGEFAVANPAGRDFADAFAKGNPAMSVVRGQLAKLVANDGLSDADRNKLIASLAKVKGRVREGRFVFERVCTSCHKVKDLGINYGPELTEVSKRLTREKLIESILYPNLEVAEQWLTTNITTRDGQELTGVVGAEDGQAVTLKLGGDQVQKVAKSNIAQRETLKVSNMPEGLAAGLAGKQGLAEGLVGASELAQLLKDMPFDGITIQVERGADAAIVVKSLEIISPLMRLTGNGRVSSKPGEPFENSPLSLQLQLAAKEQLANGLNRARQLNGNTDDRGYYLMATPFTLGGTVGKPDSSDFWKNLTLNTAGGFLR